MKGKERRRKEEGRRGEERSGEGRRGGGRRREGKDGEEGEGEECAYTSAWFPAWELLLVPFLLPSAELKVLINTAIAMNIHFTR